MFNALRHQWKQKIRNEVKLQIAEIKSEIESKIKNMNDDMNKQLSELKSDIQQNFSDQVNVNKVKAITLQVSNRNICYSSFH